MHEIQPFHVSMKWYVPEEPPMHETQHFCANLNRFLLYLSPPHQFWVPSPTGDGWIYCHHLASTTPSPPSPTSKEYPAITYR